MIRRRVRRYTRVSIVFLLLTAIILIIINQVFTPLTITALVLLIITLLLSISTIYRFSIKHKQNSQRNQDMVTVTVPDPKDRYTTDLIIEEPT